MSLFRLRCMLVQISTCEREIPEYNATSRGNRLSKQNSGPIEKPSTCCMQEESIWAQKLKTIRTSFTVTLSFSLDILFGKIERAKTSFDFVLKKFSSYAQNEAKSHRFDATVNTSIGPSRLSRHLQFIWKTSFVKQGFFEGLSLEKILKVEWASSTQCTFVFKSPTFHPFWTLLDIS